MAILQSREFCQDIEQNPEKHVRDFSISRLVSKRVHNQWISNVISAHVTFRGKKTSRPLVFLSRALGRP